MLAIRFFIIKGSNLIVKVKLEIGFLVSSGGFKL